MPDTTPPLDALAVVQRYHQRSKHALNAYAAGPETLDWDAQPDPFRRYAGTPLTPLPLPADGVLTSWAALFTPGAVAARPLGLDSLGLLFELSFALSAWKQSGPDRWAVRVNPSSGNLHPTEAWLVATGVPGLADGLHHYAPREHALEQRARLAAPTPDGARAWVGLSSIHWREAWKYGERAFRYCQLDTGQRSAPCATPPPCAAGSCGPWRPTAPPWPTPWAWTAPKTSAAPSTKSPSCCSSWSPPLTQRRPPPPGPHSMARNGRASPTGWTPTPCTAGR